jgi:hypothetical protein
MLLAQIPAALAVVLEITIQRQEAEALATPHLLHRLKETMVVQMPQISNSVVGAVAHLR